MEAQHTLTPESETVESENQSAYIIPVLAQNIEFHVFDKNSYLVQQKKYGFNVRVNTLTYNLLLLIDGEKTLAELADLLNRKFSLEITTADLHNLLFSGKLAQCGVVKTNTQINTQHKANYLKLRVTLIPNVVLQKVSHLFGPAFSPRYFVISSIIMLLFMGLLFLRYENSKQLYKALSPENIALFWAVLVIGGLLHELGHASACRYFGASHGDIGFGFYLFTPVIYADVSDAWKLDRTKRVIIDMAGIYMELILCSLFCVAFLMTKNILLLHIGILKLIGAQANLNPFLRADAYWAVSDWLNVPNMRAKSNRILYQCFNWVFYRNKYPLVGGKDYFLLFYGVASWFFIVSFILTMLVLNTYSVLYFPINIIKFMLALITEFDKHPFDWFKAEFFKLLLPFVFYIMFYNLVARQGIKWLVKWMRPTKFRLVKLLLFFLCLGVLLMNSCRTNTLPDPAFVIYPTAKPVTPITTKLNIASFRNIKVSSGLLCTPSLVPPVG